MNRYNFMKINRDNIDINVKIIMVLGVCARLGVVLIGFWKCWE